MATSKRSRCSSSRPDSLTHPHTAHSSSCILCSSRIAQRHAGVTNRRDGSGVSGCQNTHINHLQTIIMQPHGAGVRITALDVAFCSCALCKGSRLGRKLIFQARMTCAELRNEVDGPLQSSIKIIYAKCVATRDHSACILCLRKSAERKRETTR